MRFRLMLAVALLIGGAATAQAGLLPPSPHDCRSTSENTPQLAADPLNPRHLALHYLRGDGASAVLAISWDGGATWTRTPVPDVTACTDGPDGSLVDPMMAMGSGGR